MICTSSPGVISGQFDLYLNDDISNGSYLELMLFCIFAINIKWFENEVVQMKQGSRFVFCNKDFFNALRIVSEYIIFKLPSSTVAFSRPLQWQMHYVMETQGSKVCCVYLPSYVTQSLGLLNVLHSPVFLNSEMAGLCVSMPFGRIWAWY